MAKLTVYQKISGLLLVALILSISSKSQYKLHIYPVDKDSVFITETVALQTNFQSKQTCIAYVNKLPAFLKSKGYPNSSVDSVSYDSLGAICQLYIGDPLRHTVLNTDSIEHSLLIQAGVQNRRKKIADVNEVQQVQQKILNHMEN